MPMTLSPMIEEKLGKIATIAGSDKYTILEWLVSEPLDENLRKLIAVQEGLDDVEAGRVYDHEEVMRDIADVIERAGKGQA